MGRTPSARNRRSQVFEGGIGLGGNVQLFRGSGAPTNGTSGTGAGEAGPGSLYWRTSNGALYTNTNTQASPTWAAIGTVAADTVGATELGVTAGANTASKALVVNSAKSVDILQATGSVSVGGTGVPAAAAVQTEKTKAVTAFTDTVAKTVFTITIPNAVHSALIELDLLGVLGAGGAIGAGESNMAVKYLLSVVRTAGVNAAADLSTEVTGGSCKKKVAGADDITSVVATLAAVSGAVGVSNTIDVQVAITRSGLGADNHTLVASARILNQNATGVSIA